MKVLIVDDEALAVERLALLSRALPGVEVIGTALDGPTALSLIRDGAPDLLLLDIEMPGLDGIAVAREAAGAASRPAIVFVTAHESFAVLAFELEAVDYLLKPVGAERLAVAFERARHRSGAAPDATELWVPHLGALLRLVPSMIDLIEAERDYVRLHVGARSHLLRGTIGDLEQRLLPHGFLRVHRSILVPRRHLDGLRRMPGGTWHALLAGGRVVKVGRRYLPGLRR